MKHLKSILYRSIPMILVTVIMLSLSFAVFTRMIDSENNDCRELLDISVRTISNRISVRFTDQMNLLERVSDAIVLKDGLDEREKITEYLQSVCNATLFRRIDILLPGNTLILSNGKTKDVNDQLPYEVILEKGTHISQRYVDHTTGENVIYCASPIETDDGPMGVLIGVIECASLGELFSSIMYDGNTQVYLVDRTDGNFLINTTHSGLGNITNLKDRAPVDGFESRFYGDEIRNGQSGSAAFHSADPGKIVYMRYMPVEGFNWEVLIAVHEDVAFADVAELELLLAKVGIVEMLLVFLYLLFSVTAVFRSVKNEENVRRMELDKAKNETRTMFLSSMSHDIRTPLNGINGMLEIIERHGDDPQQVESALSKIKVSTQYLISLADDILDMNEIEHGRIRLVNEAFDLRTLAKEITTIITPRADEANIKFNIDCSDIEHNIVDGSIAHIRRVLINLIINAIKYNRENGEVWVKFEELCEESDGIRSYRFTVRDTGRGISEEFRKDMFKAFEKEDYADCTPTRGRGLGLSIVDRLVKLMNGRIEVESEVGVGSIFTLTIPLSDAGEKTAKKPIEIEGSELRLDGMKALLAEDNELNMEIATILIADLGAQVVTAENGQLALEAFERSQLGELDFILMDIMMPEMDGIEATKAIRELPRADAREIPIIALTAGTASDDLQRFKSVGINEYIKKPIDIKSLKATLAKYRK